MLLVGLSLLSQKGDDGITHDKSFANMSNMIHGIDMKIGGRKSTFAR